MPWPSWGSPSAVITCLLQIIILYHPATTSSGLLTSTLETFQEASCEGESMKMSCPPGMLISIQLAQYGRQVPSSEMCPPETQSDDPFYGRQYRSNVLWEDTNCLATTSLTVILETCQDRQQCHLVASAKTFQQDPCPGTRKYLEVAYKCKPSEFSSETVCEGEQLELRCSRSTRIAISSALFGRTPQGDQKCPELLRNTSAIKSTCQSKYAMEELMRLCHGRKRCTIDAEEYMFGNPCPPGVNKYLNIVYTCEEVYCRGQEPYKFCLLTVPKQVLKPLRHHNHRKHQKQKPYDDDKHRNIPSSHERSSHNKTLPHTTPAPEKPSADFPDTVHLHPSDPLIGQSKDSQNSKGNQKSDSKLGKDSSLEAGNTTPCMNQSRGYSGPSATGLLTDWLNAFNFIRENKEKAVLYLVLGVAFGVISLLFLVIIRLAIVNKRKSKAKLDISEPAHRDHTPPSNHIEAPTLERTDSLDRIEVVRFNPMRSRDFATCTLRSDIGNRSLTNYYG